MANSESAGSQPISLENLIALNDEIASLVRAGVPLELGLRGFRSGVRGQLAQVTDKLAQNLVGGSSLSEALEAEGEAFPPVYRAVIQAGLKIGRLPEAVEALTGYAQSMLDIRRRIGQAFVYPLCVLTLAYLLFVGFLAVFVPELTETYELFRIERGFLIVGLTWLSETLPYWAAVPPILLVLALVWWFVSSRWMLSARRGGWLAMLSSLPWVRQIVLNYHRANFAEMLALLVEHRIPLHEATLLAAETTGDPAIIADARRIAADLRSGRSLADSLQAPSSFPPFMVWMMSTGESQRSLALALRQTTEIYRNRAVTRANWFKLLFPIVLVGGLGGGATLVYALSMFLPLIHMLNKLGLD
jgi:general secretion pathway protein F